ncbi:MAG: hypothetical protein PHY72_01000 [Candidatus Pacebacteria bacterium]|nr:hypothetical protein [Candidatus Paceibacterota bacterium]
MRKILIVILSFVVVTNFFACGEASNSDSQQAKQTEESLSEAQRQIGMPTIVNFQQRKMMKWIYELADREDLITYTYIKADYMGKLIFMCKSIGYGIPFSAQFTNPEKVVQGDQQLGYDLPGRVNYPMTLPQADPNGLFMPVSSTATWVISIDPETGKPRPIYIEPEIVVSPYPLSPYLKDIVIGDESKWGKNIVTK